MNIYKNHRIIRSGWRRYQNLTQFYQDHMNVNHPSHIKVRARELEFMPELEIVEYGGVWAWCECKLDVNPEVWN